MAAQDAIKQIDNRRVTEAIQAIRAEATPENSRRLTAALIHKDTQFLVPMGGQNQKALMTLNAPDGKRFLPAYTSVAELRKCPSVTPRQRITLVDIPGYARLLEEHEDFSGVVIDPQGANFLLNRPLLARLRSRKEELDSPRPVTILSPKEGFSNDMTKAVGKALYKVPEVDACFLRIAQRGEGEAARRNWLFIVDYHGKEFMQAADLIVKTCEPFLPKGEQVDVASYDSELGRQVTQQGDPFFRRQMLWV